MNSIDSYIVGHITQDKNIDYDNKVSKMPGGAVYYSSAVAQNLGYNTYVITKAKSNKCKSEFLVPNNKIIVLKSGATTKMLNVYLDKKREKRDSKALSVAKNFTINDFQKCVKRPAKLIHFAGLLHGDFDNNIYEYCSHFNSKISVDAQTLLRHIKKDGTIYYKDFAQKNKIFKYIDCLKVGEYESYILTNETDIKKSAYKIANLGVKEIFFVTKNKLIVFYNSQFCSFKLKPKSLIGRTGRGDTAFASYIHKRINNNVKESLLFSAALLSLKLESIGAFANTEQNVLDFISMHY